MSIYAKRSPYPYHVKIGSVGLLIGTPRPGAPALVSQKTQDIAAVNPPDYSYGSSDPTGDREEAYESLVLGMGLDLQEKWQDYRYRSARGVDMSVWPWCKGPEITQFTPPTRDSSAGCREFFELGGALYCAQGRYILKRVSDASWTVAKDFGAGEVVLDVQVFQSNFDGVQRAFIALGTGVAQWSSDGATWTPFATFHALAFAVVAREFYWADNINRLRKLDTNADPTNEANYTSLIFRVGDQSSSISAMMVTAGGILVVAKTDGLYTLDQAGDDHVLFPFLRYAPTTRNGRVWGQFENSLYSAYGNSLGRIDTDLSWTSVGPDKLVNNTSEVNGWVSAFAGVESSFAWVGLFNTDSNTGYLCKFGAWAPQQLAAGTSMSTNELAGEASHIDAWHGSLSDPFPNRAIQALFVSAIGAPAGHTRTYLGFSDGGVGWLVNSCAPNPSNCTAYRYVVGDHYVDLPTWHGLYHASIKALHHFSVTGPVVNSGNNVTLEYRIDPGLSTGTYVDFGHVFDGPEVFEQFAFPVTAFGTLADFRVHLHNTSNTQSPLISAVAIGHALRPLRLMEFECEILCADGLVRRDGVPLRIGRQQIKSVVLSAVDNPGAVQVTLPDESVHYLSFRDYSVSQSFDEVGRQWRGSLKIKAVQWFYGD